jgi:hypothetical protein
MTTLYFTALPTVITHITIIALGTYNTSSWYIFLRGCDLTSPSLFSDDCCLLESSILTDSSWVRSWVSWLDCFLLLLWTACFHITRDDPFTDCPLLPSLSLIYRTPRSTLPLWVQRVHCCENFCCHELAFHSLSDFLGNGLLYLSPRNC